MKKMIKTITTRRCSMGDNVVLGDTRWAGLYGIEADFVADENCKICYFTAADLLVRLSYLY